MALGAVVAIGVVVVKSSGDDDAPRTPTPVIQPAVNAPLGGGDLDCVDIGREVSVGAYDPNGLDRDNDGIGCEGW